MRLRQVVLAAADLRATRTAVEDHLGLPHVWADPGVAHFGLRNALYLAGDTFLEVVAPFTPEAPAQRFLDRSGGDHGYMLLVQTTDPLDEVRTRAESEQVRIVFEAHGEGVTGLHLHPADTRGTLLSIDRCDDEPAWPWGGPAWTEAPDRGAGALRSVTIAVGDPPAVAARWAGLLAVPVGEDHVLSLDGGEIRFVRAADFEGIVAAAFDGAVHRKARIAGVDLTVA
jgi:catechol 2,3-dioxygenase-like lactoylglutathione lyase family enzyme